MEIIRNTPSTVFGYFLAVIGAACYGLNPLFVMPLYTDGITPMSVLFYRYAISAVLMGIYMFAKGYSFRLTKNEALATMAMGALFASSSAGLFCSFRYMDPGLASVILFTYPLFVALLSWLVFHEDMTRKTFISIIVALLGICLLYNNSIAGSISLTGILLAVISGFTYAVYLVGVNRSVLKDMSILRLSFFALAFGSVLFFISTQCGTSITPLSNLAAWTNVLGLSIFPTIVSLLLITRSIHIIGSTQASIIGAIEPITALAVSVFVFGGSLTRQNMIGISLIIGAVLFIIYNNRSKAMKTKQV